MKIRKTILGTSAAVVALCAAGAACLSVQAVENRAEHRYSIKDVTVLQSFLLIMSLLSLLQRLRRYISGRGLSIAFPRCVER